MLVYSQLGLYEILSFSKWKKKKRCNPDWPQTLNPCLSLPSSWTTGLHHHTPSYTHTVSNFWLTYYARSRANRCDTGLLRRNAPGDNGTHPEQEEAFFFKHSHSPVVWMYTFRVFWFLSYWLYGVQRSVITAGVCVWGDGISSLPALLPVLGQLQGVALKIQISICELSLGVWNPSLPALLPGWVEQVTKDILPRSSSSLCRPSLQSCVPLPAGWEMCRLFPDV